jgi:competence protein ComEC
LLWLLAGLALITGRGLDARADYIFLEKRLTSDGETAVRARLVVAEGWTRSRWGFRTRGRIDEAASTIDLALPGTCGFEVRGETDLDQLPSPGSVVDVLAVVRGQARRPLLVASSPRLVDDTGARRFLPVLRENLARTLFVAAGTHAGRIRTAELASALALGRRDLVPVERRDRWRRSGLAHLLAVSGLHVGLVGGGLWMVMVLLGMRPRPTRIALLIALPLYALLAGASPSAMRAALMGVIYLGARLLGRAILPMSAVLLTTCILLFARPGLIAQPGFQLTVVITAALVRWVPVLARLLPGPIWLTGAIAVPLVAQTAAVPLVAFHFRNLIPGAILTNLLALPLLAPTVLASVCAVVVAPIWTFAAGVILEPIRLLSALILLGGGPARAVQLIIPPPPPVVLTVLITAGWLALQSAKRAKIGATIWLVVLAFLAGGYFLPSTSRPPTVELLPVTDGAAMTLSSGRNTLLIDAGRYRRETAQLLADGGLDRLTAVAASHTDEDHIGGLEEILRITRVERLVLPVWMLTDAHAVPLLRAARSNGVVVEPVARGSALTFGEIRMEVLWPPVVPPREENERSLVTRVVFGPGAAIVTSDIGRSTEDHVSSLGSLDCEVLVVAHHGSRSSTSATFLEETSPSFALIPAGIGNTHGHPHREVLERLADRGIVVRRPEADGRCGVRWQRGRWEAYP